MLGVRIDADTETKLAVLARRQGRTKSAIVREAIQRYISSVDLAGDARRQSLAVSGDEAEREAISFVEHTADLGNGA